MSREKLKELLKRRSTKVGSVVLAAAIVFSGSMWAWKDSRSTVPELVTYVDMAGDVTIEEEETPLAKPKVTTKTKKTTKKIKLKTASSKTYTKKDKPKKSSTSSTSTKGLTTVTTKVETTTSVVNKFKKGSKVQTQITTVKTKTTVSESTKSSKSGGTTTLAATSTVANGEIAVATAAPKVDSRVSNAFSKMGCKIVVNSGVNYDGLFDARTRTITIKAANETIYHELGHFLAFVAGNYDRGSEFAAIFAKEKSLYTAYNKAYVLQNASEYFAESFRNYTLDRAALQASRPETFAAIEQCLAKVTDTQVNAIMTAYSAIWK